ncbi:MAG: MGMT family protein [Calditerrivibrio sp.]|nr:MGMT family protein [Calditerrivibrio sp.]
MNSIVIPFFNVSNLEIYWDNSNIPLKIEFTQKNISKHNLPQNIAKIVDVLENYFDVEDYDIFHILSGVIFNNFDKTIYKTLSKIPMGHTITYSELAKLSGQPKATRAVGNSMKRNRFPLIIPCHRVVSKHGLGGFSAGIELKVKLLEMEKRYKKKGGI